MKKYLKIVFIILILAVLVFGAFFVFKKTTEKPRENFAFLEAVDGSVLVSYGEEKKTIVNSLLEIRQGDVIKTRENSFAILYFADDIIMRLDKNTEIRIEKFDGGPDNFQVAVFLNSGRIWSRVDKELSGGSFYTIKTLNSEMKAMGTNFGVNRTGEATELFVTGGKVAVQAVDIESGVGLVKANREINSFEGLKIEDEYLIKERKLPLTLLLTSENLMVEWLRFNIFEDHESSDALNIGDKTKAIKDASVGLANEERVLINKKPEWFLSKLIERLQADRTNNATKFVDVDEMIRRDIEKIYQRGNNGSPDKGTATTTGEITSLGPLLIASIDPGEGVGSSYNLYLDVTIKGAGFREIVAVSLDSTPLENVIVDNEKTIRAKIPGSIKPGSYALSVSRADGKTTTLINAFKVTEPYYFGEEEEENNN